MIILVAWFEDIKLKGRRDSNYFFESFLRYWKLECFEQVDAFLGGFCIVGCLIDG